jgi:arylsulfatase A-like enzyme
MDTKRTRSRLDLAIAVGLGIFLLLASYVRVWGDTDSAAFDGKILRATLSQPIWGTALAYRLSLFVAALIVVYGLFGLMCFMLAKLARHAWPESKNSTRTWIMLWFILGTLWILVANATWFPLSSLGAPYAAWAKQEWLGMTPLAGLSLALAASVAITLLKGLSALSTRKWPLARTAATTTVVGGAIGVASLLTFVPHSAGSQPAASKQPHVILIGLDSLRTDVARGESAATLVPSIHAFLQQSAVFSDTTTPLARTFPAWVSILTGRHPHTTGAVVNLFPRELIREGDTLPEILHEGGYKTVYAIDEVRFSNLDKSYGFDEMISPPIGAADFVLGFFADSPLSNLLVNTRLGGYLFPYAHGNRAASITYEPDTFVDRLDRELHFEQPTFLAVHMTLAHWPYSWASAKPILEADQTLDAKPMYQQAVQRLDTQFKDVVDVLRRKGALENAIVVVLSDHGESLGEFADPKVPRLHDVIPERYVKETFGHGTDIFAEQQYQVVFGVRSFGSTPLTLQPGQTINAPASLEDLAPTLVDALGMRNSTPFDGRSLLPLLQARRSGTVVDWSDRIRFTETEFNPPGVALGQIITTSALTDAAEFYSVNPVTDRIHIRQESLQELLANRQYAASRDGRVLASVPVPDGPGHFVAYIEHPGAQPRWIDADAVAKDDPKVADLWAALNDRFPSTRMPSVLPAVP